MGHIKVSKVSFELYLFELMAYRVRACGLFTPTKLFPSHLRLDDHEEMDSLFRGAGLNALKIVSHPDEKYIL